MSSKPMILLLLSSFLLSTSLGYAIPEKPSPAASRILKKQLSDEEHYAWTAGQDLDHDGAAEGHNRDFDHEAFLGSNDEADEFDKLSPEESKARLAKIVDRIDVNGDGNVTESELKNWIYTSQRKYILEDVSRQWEANTDNDPNMKVIPWAHFHNKTYGFLEEIKGTRAAEDLKPYKDMLKMHRRTRRRDERRWDQADIDGDGSLSKEEFVLFLHPEESPRMHPVVVEETLEDIDRDGDGRISEAEYISDMYAPEDEHAQYVPEWVTREREQFKTYRDKNGDGYLDKAEIREWIVPTDYDHAEAEAKHLIFEADKNKDGLLSKEEIIDNYDVFVGSQATDFGDALVRHDEF